MRRHRPARRLAMATAGLFGPAFAVPLFVDPYRWARAFGTARGASADPPPPSR